MAALAPSFWTESKAVHNEHQALLEDLNELDFALIVERRNWASG